MKINVEERADKARENFKAGYNCCQSVILAYADVFDMKPELAASISSGFGGGIGRMREVCGACSGMFMVGSLALPAVNPENKEAKAANYQLMQDMAGDFKKECGSIICRELLGLDKDKKESCVPETRTEAYYKKRPCAETVHLAATIAGNKLNEILKDKDI